MTLFACLSPPLPAPPPTASPSAAPSPSAADEPENQQEQHRADRGVDDRSDNTHANVDAELRQQPVADEGAYDSDDEVAEDPIPGAAHDLAGQPSGNDADQQDDEETFTRHDTLSQISTESGRPLTAALPSGGKAAHPPPRAVHCGANGQARSV